MIISYFDKGNKKFIEEAAELLIESFPLSYSDSSIEEMENILSNERITLMAVENNKLIGFVGAIPQYGIKGWELHPIVVSKKHQLRGIGEKLIQELEIEVAKRSGLTIYLGCDDELGQTSLSNNDLYNDLYNKIQNIKNYNNHPYEFYTKMGYKIVGVIPDANGIGKPDIWMAKRVSKI